MQLISVCNVPTIQELQKKKENKPINFAVEFVTIKWTKNRYHSDTKAKTR